MGSDAGDGAVVKTLLVQGRKATVIAFCDPASKRKC